VLDSSYKFYLREVYKDKNSLNENILKTNVDKSNTANKIRIEVEYLLISWKHKNIIYISTIPDKYQQYYSSNIISDTLINAYDFSTFHFGKIDLEGEGIYFISKDEKKLITWDIRPFIPDSFPNKIYIREIAVQRNYIMENVILINKALEEPLTFTKQKNFTIIFQYPHHKTEKILVDYTLCTLFENKIFFYQHDHGFDLYFRFNRNIGDSKDSAIRFDAKRTRYSPVKLLEE
jgi:hypothetical protein